MKVLYIYSGARNLRFNGVVHKDFPDSQFYGLHYMLNFGIDAKYKELSNIFLKLPFNIRHAMMFFRTSDYDVVFGPALLSMMIFKKIFQPKRKFVLLNISIVRMHRKSKGLKRKLIVSFLREFDAIVCLALSQVEYIKENLPELSEKIFFVPLGVDVIYHRPGFGRENFILSVGKDNARDYKTVLEVAMLLPEERFKIVCSPRNFKDINEIPPNVEVIFGLPMAKLKEEYEAAKAILIITKDDNCDAGADSSGQTVLLESMASGLPIIASRRKSLWGYVEDGKEALLVDFYDSISIAHKIRLLKDNKELARELGKNARKKAELEFSSKIMAERLSDIFHHVSR